MTSNLDYWAMEPFASQAEVLAAMQRPEYKDPYNSAYRDAVAAKLALTEQGAEQPGSHGVQRTAVASDGAMKAQRTGPMTIIMSTGPERPSLEEQAARLDAKALPSFSQPSGPTK